MTRAPSPARERPLVAVTATVQPGGARQQPAVFLYADYVEALERAGLAPVLLTPAHSRATVHAILDACSGLVLSGGEDVEPARFGAVPHPALGAVSPARDELEWQALDRALERQLPVLGICRGIQVLNVYFGGTLYQDLQSELPGEATHDPAGGLRRRLHYVTIDEGARLREIAGTSRIFTNSSHHQAVREVAPALAVTARTEDGVIEGVEARNGAWVIGVQWHPERYPRSAPRTDPDRLLFQAFRRAAAARRARPGPEPKRQHA